MQRRIEAKHTSGLNLYFSSDFNAQLWGFNGSSFDLEGVFLVWKMGDSALSAPPSPVAIAA
jgi:hypothetical protein